MECSSHQKSYVGMCQMCGKQLCKLCIAKIKGIRVWCTTCSTRLDKFPDLRVHTPIKEIEQHARNSDAEWFEVPKPAVRLPERSCTEKFGYFDFAALAKDKTLKQTGPTRHV